MTITTVLDTTPTSAELQGWAKQLLPLTSFEDGVLIVNDEAERLLNYIQLEHGQGACNLTSIFVARMHNLIRRDADELINCSDDEA